MIKKNLNLIMPLTILLAVAAIAAGCGRPAGSGSGQTASIQVKGSDTMVNLTQAWAEAYMKEHPEAGIAVTGGGSGTGIAALLNGTTDIAIASREIEDKETAQAQAKGITPVETVTAMDGIAVIVNPANKVGKLTVDQLSGIFTGKTTGWSAVGGSNNKIVALSRDRNSGTHVFFLEHVLRKGKAKGPEEYGQGVLLLPSNQAIADEVAGSPDAIGYVGLGYLSDKVKAVAVASDKSAAYVKPSVTTVIDRTYPISRSLQMYTNGTPQGLARDFIDFILSPAGQKIVEEQGFVPVGNK